MKLHEFRCHFREVGRATVPAKPVGTVADPTLVHKQSFFFDQTGRFSGRGGARMKLHEIQYHFYGVPHAVAEYRLRRPLSPIKF